MILMVHWGQGICLGVQRGSMAGPGGPIGPRGMSRVSDDSKGIYACILVIQIFDGRADQPENVFADLKMTNLAAVEVLSRVE